MHYALIAAFIIGLLMGYAIRYVELMKAYVTMGLMAWINVGIFGHDTWTVCTTMFCACALGHGACFLVQCYNEAIRDYSGE